MADNEERKVRDITDALAMLTAYRHGAGSEIMAQLLSEAGAKASWYDREDYEHPQIKALQVSIDSLTGKIERLTDLLGGMTNLSDSLLKNWANAADADADELLELVGRAIVDKWG